MTPSEPTDAPSPLLAGATALVLLLLALVLPCTPAWADESLEKDLTKVTKSEQKFLAKDLARIVKDLKAQLGALEAAVTAGDLSPGQAFIQGFFLVAQAHDEAGQLLDLFELGFQISVGACLDELEQVPTGVQPGGCGITDWRQARQDKTLTRFRDKLGKGFKKFAGRLAKQGGVIHFQLQRLPQPPQAGIDLEQGPTLGLVKPTAFVLVASVAVAPEAQGDGPASAVAVLALADPANGATVDLELRAADGTPEASLDDVPIGPECLVQAVFEDVALGVHVVELVHGGQRLSQAVLVEG